MLFYCLGPWAYYGIGFSVADSLEPLKTGVNPFRLVEGSHPYVDPKHRDTPFAKACSPNDWMFFDGRWIIPVEGLRRDAEFEFVNMIWTATEDMTLTKHEAIETNGHDPGICTDGELYYLFNDDDHAIACCSAKDPTGPWKDEGVVLEVGGHTGDADVLFFNNRWHMVFDDGPHRDYRIGYAWTTPEEFPRGWRLENRVFGPEDPWEQPTEAGNEFGTGDGDLAVDGDTLYMVYERPIGIAWKELEVYRDETVTAMMTVEYDRDGDGRAEASQTVELWPGKDLAYRLNPPPEGRCRFTFALTTENPSVSPLIRNVTMGEGAH